MNDRNYPFVTDILRKTEPKTDNDRLAKWKADVGEAEAERIRDKSFERGNKFDAAVQNYFSSGFSGNTDIDRYMKRWSLMLSQEQKVYNDKYQYAGRLDFRGNRDGATWLVDWKTAGKPKKRQYFRDELLQLAAYYFAHDADGNFVATDFAMIVQAVPQGDGWGFHEHHFNESQLKEIFKQFLDRRSQFLLTSQINSHGTTEILP